jgi:hypothetical protein
MLGAAGATAVAALSVWAVAALRRWRRKSPDELERFRRLELHRRGRITHGHILDVLHTGSEAAPRTTLVYAYEVAGVTYEVGQDVTTLPEVVARAPLLPGHDVLVKHDRKQPANSIVACEAWSGISHFSEEPPRSENS